MVFLPSQEQPGHCKSSTLVNSIPPQLRWSWTYPPPPRGRAGATKAASPSLPPQKSAQRVGGKRTGQPRRPMQTLCDELRAPACKSCKGHSEVRHYCSRHHEGHPRVLGGGPTVSASSGGGVQQQLGTMPFGGPVRAPAPSSGGGGSQGLALTFIPTGGGDPSHLDPLPPSLGPPPPLPPQLKCS